MASALKMTVLVRVTRHGPEGDDVRLHVFDSLPDALQHATVLRARFGEEVLSVELAARLSRSFRTSGRALVGEVQTSGYLHLF